MAYTSITRAQLRQRIQDRYTSHGGVDPFWTDPDANDAINESLRYFNLYTGYWRTTPLAPVTAATTAGSPFLLVPGTLTKAARIVVGGRALQRKSIVEWYRTKRNWRTQTLTSGSPVPTTIREWAPIGLARIAIWPTDPAGGTVVTFEAITQTPILLLDASFLNLGDEEIHLLVCEALWILCFKRPSLLESYQASTHQVFLQGMLERNDQLRGSSYFRQALGLDQEQRLEHRMKSNDELTTPGTQPGGQSGGIP